MLKTAGTLICKDIKYRCALLAAVGVDGVARDLYVQESEFLGDVGPYKTWS